MSVGQRSSAGWDSALLTMLRAFSEIPCGGFGGIACRKPQRDSSTEGKMIGVKRLRRIAWNALAAVSALLCVATCIFWARSYCCLTH